MKESDLSKFVGSKIKYFRKKKKLTQSDLGELIGKKNNTISNYETGTISPEQDALFAIAKALGIKVDDLFPAMEIDDANNNFERALKMTNGLELDEMNFLKDLIEKTLSMQGEDREKFLESIRFTVEYYEKLNRN
ncbi:helix-turn-helix domain-containing protein [Sporosarcina sp. A2]|uniref:helix-turn-helix domain-containing protein n=1 Tax=Sporosarcina sp. A2 TaxID=3393449 RepID=UPI003D79F45A